MENHYRDKNSLDLKQIQKAELNMLKKVIRYFEKNDITYLLGYGTLLGAVRHGGFIPWDDDVDLLVPRKDYEKIKELARESRKIADNIEILVPGDKGFPNPFIKIVDKSIRIFDKLASEDYERYLWIDLFPLDHIPNNMDARNKIYKHSRWLLRVLAVKTKKKCRITPLRTVGIFINFLYGGTIKICLKLDKYGNKINKRYENSSYFGNVIFPENNDTFHNDMVFPMIKLSFEGVSCNCPKSYHEHLRAYYGDYMTLPPTNQRIRHHIEAYRVVDKRDTNS